MEHLPLLLTFTILSIWIVGSIVARRRGDSFPRVGISIFAFSCALFQLGLAIWSTVITFTANSAVSLNFVWFQLPNVRKFELALALDTMSALMWLLVSLVTTLLSYFSMFANMKSSRLNSKGEALVMPLVSFGMLLAISGTNFAVFYGGWALIGFVGFLAISFSNPTRNDRARASFRYISLNALAEVIFVAGVLGVCSKVDSLSFDVISQKAQQGEVPIWAILALVVGAMLRNLQLPLMQCARYLSTAKWASFPVLFGAHTLLGAVFLAKLYPAIAQCAEAQYLVFIPAVTVLLASILLLPEREPSAIAGWLAAYVSGTVFLSGLAGSYHAAQALALTGTLAAFLVIVAMTEFEDEEPVSKWMIGLGTLVLAGLPIAGLGWARYIEYLGLLPADSQGPTVQWAYLQVKILADVIVGIALFGFVLEQWRIRATAQKTRWEIVMPTVLMALLTLSISIGGLPLGALIGHDDLGSLSSLAWFERLIVIPSGAPSTKMLPPSQLLQNGDIFARVIALVALVLPLLLSYFWLFRDAQSSEEFRASVLRLTKRFGVTQGTESSLWAWLIKPTATFLGRAADWVERRVFDFVFVTLWIVPIRFVRNLFLFVENKIIDRALIDGIGSAVATVGKSLRLIQSGQVQLYFSVGIILMGAVVVKFLLFGR